VLNQITLKWDSASTLEFDPASVLSISIMDVPISLAEKRRQVRARRALAAKNKISDEKKQINHVVDEISVLKKQLEQLALMRNMRTVDLSRPRFAFGAKEHLEDITKLYKDSVQRESEYARLLHAAASVQTRDSINDLVVIEHDDANSGAQELASLGAGHSAGRPDIPSDEKGSAPKTDIADQSREEKSTRDQGRRAPSSNEPADLQSATQRRFGISILEGGSRDQRESARTISARAGAASGPCRMRSIIPSTN
jgi:hypothetical protein